MNDEYRMNLRLPRGIEAKLRSSTSKTNRSLTGEIINRLENSFNNEATDLDTISAQLTMLGDKLKAIEQEQTTLSSDALKLINTFGSLNKEQQKSLMALCESFAKK